MTETFCTSAAVKFMAGASRPADDTVITGDDYTRLINEAESEINDQIRINFTDIYGSLNNDVKKLLESACAAHAAMAVIQHDMSGYTSRAEAQTMLDVNYTRFKDAMAILEEKEATKFIQEA